MATPKTIIKPSEIEGEFIVQGIDAYGRLVCEYFTDEKQDAIDTAALIREELNR